MVCGKPEVIDHRADILLNPTILFEVLSPSTERFDRGFQFDVYTEIASLREYVLVASDRASVEVFSREADGRWLLAKAIGLANSIDLLSIGCRLSLVDIYRNVDFAAEATA